jgi:hypothetical protein
MRPLRLPGRRSPELPDPLLLEADIRQDERVSKRQESSEASQGETPLDLSHLRREARTALELAVAAMAPSEIIDRLAAAAGLLEAIGELPPNSPPVLALVPGLVKRSRVALEEWQRWHEVHLAKVKA